MKSVQADADLAEEAKIATTRQLTDLQRKYEELANQKQPADLSKYKEALTAYKADNTKLSSTIKAMNEKFEHQERMMTDCPQRELDFSQKLQDYINLQTRVEHNEELISNLNETKYVTKQ